MRQVGLMAWCLPSDGREALPGVLSVFPLSLTKASLATRVPRLLPLPPEDWPPVIFWKRAGTE